MEYEYGITTHEEMILDLAARVEALEEKLEKLNTEIDLSYGGVPVFKSGSCGCSPTRFTVDRIGLICWNCDMEIKGDTREYMSEYWSPSE